MSAINSKVFFSETSLNDKGAFTLSLRNAFAVPVPEIQLNGDSVTFIAFRITMTHRLEVIFADCFKNFPPFTTAYSPLDKVKSPMGTGKSPTFTIISFSAKYCPLAPK